MIRLFSSTEDFTKPEIQIDLLIRDGVVYKRVFVKALVQGKTIKMKKKWEKLEISEADLMKKACGFRNKKPYRLFFEKRFFFSSKVNPTMGPE